MAFIIWIFKQTVLLTIYGFLTLTFLIYAPFLLDINPESFNIPLPTSYTGPFPSQDVLSKVEHLFEDQFHGPESVAEWKGDIFTAVSDGRILRIRNNKHTTVADVSEGQCEGPWEGSKCGQPLGIKFDSQGYLYVIDAYNGLKRVDIPSGKGTVTKVFDSKTKVEGRAPVFLDDVAILEGAGIKGGNVYYMTDVSSKWNLADALYVIAEHSSTGRLIRYDEDTDEATVVKGNLNLPNGLELMDSKDALLLCETNNRRILKHYVQGAKTGQTETFLEHLPGGPDNIRRSSDLKVETYWVAIVFGRNASTPGLFDVLSNKPFMRKALYRLMHAIGFAIEYIGTKTHYIPLKELGFSIKSGSALIGLMDKNGLLLEVNKKGEILRYLYSSSSHPLAPSEVREVKEGNKKVLYIGSFFNNFLGKLIVT